MTLPTDAVPARRLTRLASAALVAASTLAVATGLAAPAAHANAPGPHDAIGKAEHIVANSDGSYTVTGWAGDPDALTSNATVQILVDGERRGHQATSVARPAIARKYHTGATPGFSISATPGSGAHTICVAGLNVGAGMSQVLGCFATPLGSTVNSAAHSPVGKVASTTATTGTLTVVGHVNDPDFYARRMTVVLYVDGTSAKTVNTNWVRVADGTRSNRFSMSVPVATGAHLGCVWAVNVGFGANSFLGCAAADTRGRAGTGTVRTPAKNTTAVHVAKSEIGKAYVWGAAGPRTFDCSGLVTYSYAKAGIGSNVPHQSGMQFNLARAIPASRAVPGDLVFYHDSVGSVYHVGIYLSPGNTVAAIDESEGVNYQHIWDPSTATYGSLTHT
jgi:cell wall-associated NlpC family hydrolase